MTNRDVSASRPVDLAMVQAAVQRGDRRLAHEMCVQLTTDDPANEQAWLWRAGTAESLEEASAALSQALTLNPANNTTRHGLYEAMQGLLRQDAFLEYLAETDDFYHIRTHTNLTLAHPKDRATAEPFPPPAPPPAREAFRWLGWSVIGLIPAGLGALICAPVAMLAAIHLLRSRPSKADRQRAWLVMWGSLAVWLLAALLVQILILHLL